jgi:hypothetical protein
LRIQNGETFLLELGEEVVYMQEMEGKHGTQLQNETFSIEKTVKVEDERYAHLQNKMESLKRMVKVE